ncbi:MAG TPA: sugar-binding domain-containing protein [Candidatus Limnocylindrales bacterium]|nr:sugar-binding domain-containing protein [Candidatus Limnocylindrales bacterium]
MRRRDDVRRPDGVGRRADAAERDRTVRTDRTHGAVTDRTHGAVVSDLATLVRVARLYYELGETQEAIAAIVGVTRPQVSRLLKEARAQGVVEIRIVDDGAATSDAGELLRRRFGLRGVHLAPTLDGPPELTRRRVGRLAGEVLAGFMRDGMVVGIGDGAAVSSVADELSVDVPNVDATVVPLCGGFWRTGSGVEPFRRIGEAFGATVQSLHAPGLLDSAEVRDALCAHAGVRAVVDLWARLDVALFGIGGPSWSAASVGQVAMTEILADGAIGELLIAPFAADGRLVADGFRARTVAFDARALPGIGRTIAVAEGAPKVAPILGALRGGFVNTLVTDVRTAEAVLGLAAEAAA